MAAIECEYCDSTDRVLYVPAHDRWLCHTCATEPPPAACDCDDCQALDYLIALGPITYEVTA